METDPISETIFVKIQKDLRWSIIIPIFILDTRQEYLDLGFRVTPCYVIVFTKHKKAWQPVWPTKVSYSW
jgi:hypothetical protein